MLRMCSGTYVCVGAVQRMWALQKLRMLILLSQSTDGNSSVRSFMVRLLVFLTGLTVMKQLAAARTHFRMLYVLTGYLFSNRGLVAATYRLFCIHRMNRVNSHILQCPSHIDSTINIVFGVIIIIIVNSRYRQKQHISE